MKLQSILSARERWLINTFMAGILQCQYLEGGISKLQISSKTNIGELLKGTEEYKDLTNLTLGLWYKYPDLTIRTVYVRLCLTNYGSYSNTLSSLFSC
jgi:hypothetical protein